MINQDLQAFQTIETSQRGGFRVLSIGGVPFVQPFPAILSADQVVALQGAARVAALGRRKVAEAIVAHVQRELGVSQELHALAVEVAAAKVARGMRQVRQQREGQVRRQAAQANRTIAEPEATKEIRGQLRLVDEARDVLRRHRAEAAVLRAGIEQLRAKGEEPPAGMIEDANRARTASWAALGLMRERSLLADRMRREQLDAFWAEQATAETASLAQGRGEEIGKVAQADLEGHVDRAVEALGAKPLRISSRDGLATLFEARAITAHQYGAGRAYRVAFELASAGLKIANLNPTGVGGGKQHAGLAARSAAELQKAYVLARLRQIELAVAGLGARELRVLRMIAGEGFTVRELGGGGNSREANTAALRRALEKAVEILAAPVHKGLKKTARG